MKAILVVDVPMTKDVKHICNFCPIWNEEKNDCQYNRRMMTGKCPLNPMPSKRRSVVEWLNGFRTHDLTEYDKGWNDCVDFLEGSEND